MGNVITHKSRTDMRRVFILGGEVGHVTRQDNCSRSKVKRSKVTVTRLCAVSADKNAMTRQRIIISTSNLVGIIDVGVNACDILSRSVGQTNWKQKYGGRSENAELNGNRSVAVSQHL